MIISRHYSWPSRFPTTPRAGQTHLDALEFLKALPADKAAGVLYDPPYNDRQGKKYFKENVSRSDFVYWNNIKRQIVRIVRPGGKIIQLGWNSNRFPGPTKIDEIALFAHGSDRNDTIVLIQTKLATLF